jgi:NADPH:quinone reductase-like Zn-dependent oxidoreductase
MAEPRQGSIAMRLQLPHLSPGSLCGQGPREHRSLGAEASVLLDECRPRFAGRYSAANPEWCRETLATLLRWLAEGKIKPMVAARVPLTDARHAHELLEGRGIVGKIVLATDG